MLSSRNINDQAMNGMSTAERLIMLHRQRRTRTQQRYRKKINDKVIALEDSVIELKDEIEQLKKQRELSTPSYSLSKTTSWKMVVEYVRLFRYGYQHPTLIAHSDGTTTLSTTDSNNMQKMFLQAVMMPNIAFNGGRQGADAVFEDWKTISQHHENTETQLTCLECGEGGLLIAHMNNVSTITAKMIRNHLLDDEDSEWPSLARKLLGQSLVIPTIVRYEWDELNSRFASVYYEPDMLTPLLGLLGNLEEATRVVNSALGNHCKQ
ncbi:hypothetical protein PHMEG_0004337 [Phytophthora megakarya]|uniref:BZIP domain-containing protein n=1 Tax=Phytophthora megakarya TaxID=4795 RepID=A0A225WU37_9STRA|nr:hypothetical protein PHMEG_0004337 [Phytophthora megakarya]